MVSLRPSDWIWRATASRTARATVSEGVSSRAEASGSCSAWASISAATYSTLALSSAMSKVSVGPGSWSMATAPKTRRLASTT